MSRAATFRSVAALMAQADLDQDTRVAWRLLLAELLRVGTGGPRRPLARARNPSTLAASPMRHGRPLTM